MSRLSLWTTFLIKERGRTSFAAFGEGRSKKRPIPVLNANELLKKTRQCYYTKSHGKNATQKEEIFVLKTCDIILLLLSYFLFKGATNEVPILQWVFEKHAFLSKMLCSWLYGAVILEVKRYRYTDPICAMRYRGTVFQFAIFWPLGY